MRWRSGPRAQQVIMRAACVRREGKDRRPVGLESRELLLPRDQSPISFFFFFSFFFEKGLDPIYLVHPAFYRKHPGEDKKYNKLHSIQTPGV